MSILIKDMEMPKRCLDCPMYDCYNYHCQLYAFGIPARYNRDGSTRPEWCELVELPEKHGRLIDGDELFKQMNIAIAMMSGMMKAIGAEDDKEMQMELKAYRDIRDGIKDCETVIESEGEG